MQRLLPFCNKFPQLWLTGSGSLALAHWLTCSLFFPGCKRYVTGFLVFWISDFLWISGFLVPWLCWFCFALILSAFSGSLLSQSDILWFFGIHITVIIWKDDNVSPPKNCHCSVCIYRLQAGSNVNAHALWFDYSCSHYFTMRQPFICSDANKIRHALLWIQTTENGLHKIKLDSFYKNVSDLRSTPYNHKCFVPPGFFHLNFLSLQKNLINSCLNTVK